MFPWSSIDNRRQNIANEVSRAEEAMRAAEALLGLGLYADAVSRLARRSARCL